MTSPLPIAFEAADAAAFPGIAGQIAVVAAPDGTLDPLGRRLDRLTRGAFGRLVGSQAWKEAEEGQGLVLAMPHGLAADRLIVAKLPKRPAALLARRAGAWIAKSMRRAPLALVHAGPAGITAELAEGILLRAYDFDLYRSKKDEGTGALRVLTRDPAAVSVAHGARAGRVEGVFLTRDLVNEPANVLTTLEFAARLEGLGAHGVEVEVLDVPALEALGMRTLLGVAQGSAFPARVVVMSWRGGGDAAPIAFVGKGVCFDSGGISIKPAQGMEEMTMDMGGAGVVAGVMRTLALRGARANVVGLVGLVENMPDGNAQRPGDIVRSMKGDTIEIINTDAEGRLVLADVLWYAQERFKPQAMVNLATLTGAVIIGLGHENAGVFSNDDALAGALVAAAGAEGEGAWRMPMGKAYDRKLKSRLADMKNTGGRPGGAITAAQFLRRFVKDEIPWCHLDIAGVALPPDETDFAPKGATGWGVLTLDRLVRDRYEARDG